MPGAKGGHSYSTRSSTRTMAVKRSRPNGCDNDCFEKEEQPPTRPSGKIVEIGRARFERFMRYKRGGRKRARRNCRSGLDLQGTTCRYRSQSEGCTCVQSMEPAERAQKGCASAHGVLKGLGQARWVRVGVCGASRSSGNEASARTRLSGHVVSERSRGLGRISSRVREHDEMVRRQLWALYSQHSRSRCRGLEVIQELFEGCAGGSIRTSLIIDRAMPEELVVANALDACPRRTIDNFDDLLTVVRQARRGSSNSGTR